MAKKHIWILSDDIIIVWAFLETNSTSVKLQAGIKR